MSEFNIGTQFSNEPSARFYRDTGARSGEAFREDHLRKLIADLQPGEKITFILDDDVDTYGSSFLTEGFAGMVKYGYIEANELLSKIDFSYTDEDYEFYEERVRKYIKEAKFNSKPYVATEFKR
ncbi:STAS-like domain-containing protein [Vibrio splendidus]|uniref:STAS-like domain-containing protein n=1 Tax=Vibrio splendidus TaxID=29497 RepID=UPI00352D3756